MLFIRWLFTFCVLSVYWRSFFLWPSIWKSPVWKSHTAVVVYARTPAERSCLQLVVWLTTLHECALTDRQVILHWFVCFCKRNFKFTPFRCLRPQKDFTRLWSADAQCRSWYGGNILYCKQKTSVCGTFLKNYFCQCLSFAILCIRQMDGWIDRLIV